jgi:hypothetical protein
MKKLSNVFQCSVCLEKIQTFEGEFEMIIDKYIENQANEKIKR